MIGPQPGPQTIAAASPADMLFYGGAAGGGKSYWLLYEAAKHVWAPSYGAVIFRRTAPEIRGSGGLWEEAQEMFRAIGGSPNEGRMEWRWPGNSLIEFRHLQLERDKYNHKGKQYAFIGFDELTSFTEGQFWYLWSRMRSLSGLNPYMRATTNPDPNHFVRSMIDWWIDEDGHAIRERSGILRYFVRPEDRLVWGEPEELRAKYPKLTPISFTFVASSLEDNKVLEEKDPHYREKLMSLPKKDRIMLLEGNWNEQEEPGAFFDKYWFKIVDKLPAEPIKIVRGWDKAATPPSKENPDPDWTRGVKLAKLRNGLIAVLDVASCRKGPGGVDQLIKSVAKSDGKSCVQAFWTDPGAAGKVDEEHTRNLLRGYQVEFEPARKSKEAYAKPVSAQADPATPTPGIVLLDAFDHGDFLKELQRFPSDAHDDQVDAMSRAYRTLTAEGQGRRFIRSMQRADI